MAGKLYNIIQKQTFLIVLLAIITLLITAQSYFLDAGESPDGYTYTHYNNYVIFKSAYFHLVGNNDLYQLYPGEHWDLYKYSPTFALLMAPLARLPDAIGLSLWNLLNALIFLLAFLKFPFRSHQRRLLALAFVLIELINTTQNEQSNALVAGLIILAFLSLEKNKSALASLLIVLSVFIKLFGAMAIVLYLFYPRKIKTTLYTLGWLVLLGFLPLLVITPDQLVSLYKSWISLLLHDEIASHGLSVAGWLQTWFHIGISKNYILIAGLILFCIPLFKTSLYKDKLFRILTLSSILIWVVIFNHKAESPTFIIAVSGVAFWYFMQKRKIENLILLLLVFLFTSLSTTELFLYDFWKYANDYAVKAVPCILVWFKLIYDMLFFDRKVIPSVKNSKISN